jgi:hypothetical protein
MRTTRLAKDLKSTADDVLAHLDYKITTLKCRREVELGELLAEMIEMWDFFDHCKKLSVVCAERVPVSSEFAEAFHTALKTASQARKHLKEALSIVQKGSHRDKSSLVDCLAGSLFVPRKETPKRIPTPYGIIGAAAFGLLTNADVNGVKWPTVSEIRREVEKILLARYKEGDYSVLTSGQWREAQEYFQLAHFFYGEGYGRGPKAQVKRAK